MWTENPEISVSFDSRRCPIHRPLKTRWCVYAAHRIQMSVLCPFMPKFCCCAIDMGRMPEPDSGCRFIVWVNRLLFSRPRKEEMVVATRKDVATLNLFAVPTVPVVLERTRLLSASLWGTWSRVLLLRISARLVSILVSTSSCILIHPEPVKCRICYSQALHQNRVLRFMRYPLSWWAMFNFHLLAFNIGNSCPCAFSWGTS